MAKIFNILQHKFHCGNSYLGYCGRPYLCIKVYYILVDFFLLSRTPCKLKFATCSDRRQVLPDAQLSQTDRAAGCVSSGQNWKTGTERQYFRTL